MPDFFSREWVESFAQKWNADAEMTGPLSSIGFTAIVALGYPDQDAPSVLLEVDQGKVKRAGLFNPVAKPVINWDLRATPAQWAAWQKIPLQVTGLGVAVQKGQLQFKAGDYRKMIRTPALANPFLRFFKIL